MFKARFTIIVLCLLSNISFCALGILPGDGTSDYPYLIEDRCDFIVFSQLSDYWQTGVNVKLMCDIDLNGITFTSAVISPSSSVGDNYAGIKYNGVFDGNNHIISNMTIANNISQVNCLGLFGAIDSNGVVKNLGLTDVNITSISTTGDVFWVGALCGVSDGTISECFTDGVIFLLDNSVGSGGVCGRAYSGTIQNCYSKCRIEIDNSSSSAGGFCGWIDQSCTVQNCYSAGRIVQKNDNSGLGGFCASNFRGNIQSCFWDTEASGINYSDGGEGKTTEDMMKLSTYNYAGWSMFFDCVDGSIWVLDGYPRLRWDTDIVSIPDVLGVTQEIAENEILASDLNVGHIGYALDFQVPAGLVVGQNPEPDIFCAIEGSEVDLLISLGTPAPLAGDGTVNNPYLIQDIEDFDTFIFDESYWGTGVNTRLMCNIDLEGRVFDSALIAPKYGGDGENYYGVTYKGNFDGGGHCINNIHIDSRLSFLGLFGEISAEAVVKNLIVKNEIITTFKGEYIGGLAGYNNGQVEKCYAEVNVHGDNLYRVGGFCGNNVGTINESGVKILTSIYGHMYVLGGFCGYNDGHISDCYADGFISFDNGSYNGGFNGRNIGYINRCYSTVSCPIDIRDDYFGFGFSVYDSGIDYCFWDNEITSGALIQHAYAKSTELMKDISIFTGAGWAFSGGSAIWQMPVRSYPRLLWENVIPPVDTNNDGLVGLIDFSKIANRWFMQGCDSYNYCDNADINGSGSVEIADLNILANFWLEGKAINDDGLKVHLDFDNIQGDIAFDTSVNRNDGVLSGDPIRSNSYLIFDGLNDYIEIPGYHGVGGSDARTIAAFIRLDNDIDNSNNDLYIIMSWGKSDTANLGHKNILLIDDLTGKLAFAIYGSRLLGGPDLEDDRWHHVAAVLPEGKDNINEVLLYVDGVKVITDQVSHNTELSTMETENVIIGAIDVNPDNGIQTNNYFFKGKLDDVRIYNRALSNEEINSISQ